MLGQLSGQAPLQGLLDQGWKQTISPGHAHLPGINLLKQAIQSPIRAQPVNRITPSRNLLCVVISSSHQCQSFHKGLHKPLNRLPQRLRSHPLNQPSRSVHLTITDAVSAFLMGRFLPLRLAASLALTPPVIVLLATGDGAYFASMLFDLVIALPAGLLVRVTVNSWRSEVSAVSGQLEAIRNEVAREMHDLVAYSMSQTALRAKLAASKELSPTVLARSSPPSRPPPLTRSTSSASFCAPCAATTATTTAPRADWAR